MLAWQSYFIQFPPKTRWGCPCLGFRGGSVVKNLPANAGDIGSIPGLQRSPGEGNGNPLQCSRLGNPMGREAWWLQSLGLQRVGHDWAHTMLPDHQRLKSLEQCLTGIKDSIDVSYYHHSLSGKVLCHACFYFLFYSNKWWSSPKLSLIYYRRGSQLKESL